MFLTRARLSRASWRVLEPAFLQCEAHDIGSARQTQFHHRARFVGLNRFGADLQAIGNLFVTVSLRDELQHLGLPLAQLETRVFSWEVRPRELSQDDGGDAPI